MVLRTAIPVLVLALTSSAMCAAQSWQSATVRDVDDSGHGVVVKEDHGTLKYHTSGDVEQTYTIQAGDRVFYAQRKEGGRWAHACEVPANSRVDVKVKGSHLQMRADRDKYKFKVVKVMSAQQYASMAPPHQPRPSMLEDNNGPVTSATLE